MQSMGLEGRQLMAVRPSVQEAHAALLSVVSETLDLRSHKLDTLQLGAVNVDTSVGSVAYLRLSEPLGKPQTLKRIKGNGSAQPLLKLHMACLLAASPAMFGGLCVDPTSARTVEHTGSRLIACILEAGQRTASRLKHVDNQ